MTPNSLCGARTIRLAKLHADFSIILGLTTAGASRHQNSNQRHLRLGGCRLPFSHDARTDA